MWPILLQWNKNLVYYQKWSCFSVLLSFSFYFSSGNDTISDVSVQSFFRTYQYTVIITFLCRLFISSFCSLVQRRYLTHSSKIFERSLGKFVPIYYSNRYTFIELYRRDFVAQPFCSFHATWIFHPFRISQVSRREMFRYNFLCRENSLKIGRNFPSSV